MLQRLAGQGSAPQHPTKGFIGAAVATTLVSSSHSYASLCRPLRQKLSPSVARPSHRNTHVHNNTERLWRRNNQSVAIWHQVPRITCFYIKRAFVAAKKLLFADPVSALQWEFPPPPPSVPTPASTSAQWKPYPAIRTCGSLGHTLTLFRND